MLKKAGQQATKHWPKLAAIALLLLFTAAKAPTFDITYVNKDEPLYAWQSLAVYHNPELLFSKEISYVYAFALIPAIASPLNALFDALVAVRIITFAFALVGLYLTYLVGRKIFSEKAGIAAMALLMLSPIYFYSANKAMPDVPTAALAMLLFYLLLTINKRRAALIPPIILAMYVIRASSLVVLPPTAVYLLVKYRKAIDWKKAAILLAATAAVIAAGYLASGYTSFSPLELMQRNPDYALFLQLKFQNLFWVAFGIPITFFAVLGMAKLRKERSFDKAFLYVWIFLTVLPFLLLKLMWDRYYLFAVPPMAIIAGYGFAWLSSRSRQAVAVSLTAIAALILLSGSFAYNPYTVDYRKPHSNQFLDTFEAFLEKNLERGDRLAILCDEFTMRAYRASAEKVLESPRQQFLANPTRQEFEEKARDPAINHYAIACTTYAWELWGPGFDETGLDSYFKEKGFERQYLFPEKEIEEKGLPELYRKPAQ